MSRSLQASPEGIEQAKKRLAYHCLTQKALAEELGISRQPVTKFFGGKPVDRSIFYKICEKLNLEWEDIAAKPAIEPNTPTSQDNNNIDVIVQQVREQIKPLIQEHCGKMRLLYTTQPIRVNEIYTNVNILEKITGRRQLKIDELLQNCTLEDFAHFGLVKITEEKIPALEAVEKYSKLMILGKPGAGKTTFLKYLAMQCIEGKVQADHVPFFVTLKDFAEAENKPGLLKYIGDDTFKNLPHNNRISKENLSNYINELINHGKALILLDGLDEVREEDNKRVLKEIRDFSEQYLNNHFITTCRIAAKEYTFEKFTEVEIADFDNKQIRTFAKNWFKDKPVKPETFINRIQENGRIRELATSPLLLTLLCLTFEDSGDFPANRSELYKEGLDALLKKWDAKRGIQRHQIYKKLSVPRKEDLLSKIALATFERGDYFFKQKIAEQYITEYIRNLPGANTDEDALQLDSEEILRSIEYHHGLLVERAKGIYSFSHLTFHEYFTARDFVIVQQSSENALQHLVNNINERRWREVFLLAVGMSPNADNILLLMKNKIDFILARDNHLQQLLIWSNQTSISVDIQYSKAMIRIFYFCLAVRGKTQLVHSVGYNIIVGFLEEFNNNNLGYKNEKVVRLVQQKVISSTMFRDNKFNISLDFNYFFDTIKEFPIILLSKYITPEFKRRFLELQKQLPTEIHEITEFQEWLKYEGNDWITNFYELMFLYHENIPCWTLNERQKDEIHKYYHANYLLLECLNSDCYVSREVREYIEETLLLPMEEIEKCKAKYPYIFPNAN
ncbi:MAG TPA: NACHT domain-containing NTPase [Nostocaceae cyanobacterium]|nr:NACHT domain-containing NTPase [Nostocaceae cyanobacterium]